MLRRTKAVGTFQLITNPSHTFLGTCRYGEKMAFYPSELVFVLVPGTSEEDGGVILSVAITPDQVNVSPRH